MNLGGMGAFAGGLAGGYFEGQNAKNRNDLTAIAKQKGAREQTTFDRSIANAKSLGQQLRDLGYHQLADTISPSDVATGPGTNNAGVSDMGGLDTPAVANGMTYRPEE